MIKDSKFLIRVISIGVIIVIILIPSYVLSRIQYLNEFSLIPLVRVAASGDSIHLAKINFSGFNFISEHHGIELISLMISRLTGLPIQRLLFIPIGGILIPIVYYSLCRLCYLDEITSALITISIAYDPTISFSSYNLVIYSLSRILVLVFLVVIVHLIRKKTAGHIVILLLIFLGLYNLYWTDPLLMINFTVITNFLLWVGYLITKQNYFKQKWHLSTVIAFIIIYFSFGTFLYNILPKIYSAGGLSQITASVISFKNRIEQVLGITSVDVIEYVGLSGPTLTSQIQIIRYILIAAPIFLFLLNEIRDMARTKKVQLSANGLILYALIGTLLLHILVYSSYGHTSTRNVAFFGPLMAAMAFDRIKIKTAVRNIVIALLGILCIPSFFAVVEQVRYDAHFYPIGNASNWIIGRESENQSGNIYLYSDLGVYGMMATEMAEKGFIPTYRPLTPDKITWLIENKPTNPAKNVTINGYLVVDVNSIDPLFIPGWKYQAPLSKKIDEIKRNNQFNLYYDNGSIQILIPKLWNAIIP